LVSVIRCSLGLTHPPTILLRWFLIIGVALHIPNQTLLFAELLKAPYHLLNRLACTRFNSQHKKTTLLILSSTTANKETTVIFSSSKAMKTIIVILIYSSIKPNFLCLPFLAEKAGFWLKNAVVTRKN
jgi:hypothetical protein